MNAGALNHLELRRRTLLGQLQTADTNLRSGLHQHGMDAVVRAHLERALAHIREAAIAVKFVVKLGGDVSKRQLSSRSRSGT